MPGTQNNYTCWIIAIVIGIVVVLFLMKPERENYSPYRGTGGCSQSLKWAYLDEYDNQDYYMTHPFVYPSPTNYVKALYSDVRKNNKFLEEQRKKMDAAPRK